MTHSMLHAQFQMTRPELSSDFQRAVLNNLRPHFLNFSEMIAIKFGTDIHGAQRINPFDSGEFLACVLAPPTD